MPLLSGRGLAKLITCIVVRDGSAWSVSWASDGKTPKDFEETTFSAAVDRATSEVDALYAQSPKRAEAELQFAIYPWEGDPGKVMLDISVDADGFTVRDIQGTDITFHSESIEGVVADAERYLPSAGDAMIRWIRPLAGLTRR